MRRVLVLAVALVVAAGAVVVWLLQPTHSPKEARPRPAPRPDHVVLVDWDGFDPDYVGRVPMPNLDALIARGSLSMAQSTYPTISNSARASMVTGAYPERHGNLPYTFDPALGVARGQDRTVAVQTITEGLASQGRTSASVQWYMVEGRGAAPDDPAHLYIAPGGAFGDRVSAAIEILNRRPVASGAGLVTLAAVPDFLAVYGDDLDALAHREGTQSPNLPALLTELDVQLGRLVQSTKDAGLFEATAFILTTDHGMTDWSQPVPAAPALAHLADAGFHPEVVPPGSAPAADTDVIVVPSGVRTATISLRGAAATPQGRDAVRAAVAGLVPSVVSRALDADELRGLGAGDRFADFVLEAQPPYGFAAAPLPPGVSQAAHGSTAELSIPLVLSGRGFRAGAPPTSPKLVDVAPTIAALLGVRPPAQAQGRSLASVGGVP